MKLKKALIGMTAAVMTASCLAVSASAAIITAKTPETEGWEVPGAFTGGTLSMKVNLNPENVPEGATLLSDVIEQGSDDWYSVGAMGFYMNRTWSWNQGDWVGISDDGILDLTYEISPGKAMQGIEGETANTLGSMGFMILNIPEGNYPYAVEITDAKFVTSDGTEVILDSWNKTYAAEEFPDGGIRIVIRSDDEVDEEETGDTEAPADTETPSEETPADTGASTPAFAAIALCSIAVIASSKKRTAKN